MSFTESLVNLIVEFIDKTGYPSIFVMMSLESMVAPVPSEAVMPFAGFLVQQGRFTFTGVIFFSTLGSIFGSLISYYLGYWGGRPIVERFGKYLLLDKKDLDLTERFFQKRGDITIFISRFIPVVRHLISIPAGIGKMNIVKFCIYTIAGAGLWNAFLTYMGYLLQKKWTEIMKYSHIVDIVVVALLIIFVIYYIYKFYSNHKERKANNGIES
jgi:membrane protein DedA with SNARE-associated domain